MDKDYIIDTQKERIKHLEDTLYLILQSTNNQYIMELVNEALELKYDH